MAHNTRSFNSGALRVFRNAPPLRYGVAMAATDRQDLADPDAEALAVFDDRLGFWLRLAQQEAFDALHAALTPLGLSPARLGALLVIDAVPDIRQVALGAALRVKPPNLAVLLRGLEEEGLIRRAEDAANRRANLLRLTARGRALLRRARAAEAAFEAGFTRGLTAAERARLIAALRGLAGG
jgi:DNA-binding MarR family transcriptional regulator